MEKKEEELEIENNTNKSFEENNLNNIDKINNNLSQQKGINFQNDNINIPIDNLSPKNISQEKIKTVNNNNNDKNHNLNKTPSLVLQEKLKNIFLEREKAKLKYNKQSIPEQLKYNSDDEDSNNSKEIIQNDNNKNKDLNNNNSYNEKIEEKIQKDEIIGNDNKINLEELKDNKNEIKEAVKKEEIEINKNMEKIKNDGNDKIDETCNDEKKEICQVKSFRRRFNYTKNEDENKGKNSYQLLLSKKIKNFADEEDEEEKNKENCNNNINKKEDIIIENEKNKEVDIKEEKVIK